MPGQQKRKERHWPYGDPIFGHRLRGCPNIEPQQLQCGVFTVILNEVGIMNNEYCTTKTQFSLIFEKPTSEHNSGQENVFAEHPFVPKQLYWHLKR